MLWTLLLIFCIGCLVGALANEAARRHRQRSIATKLLRAIDEGTARGMGARGSDALAEQESNRET